MTITRQGITVDEVPEHIRMECLAWAVKSTPSDRLGDRDAILERARTFEDFVTGSDLVSA